VFDFAVILSDDPVYLIPVFFVFYHFLADFPILEVLFGHFFVVVGVVRAPEPENTLVSFVLPFDDIDELCFGKLGDFFVTPTNRTLI